MVMDATHTDHNDENTAETTNGGGEDLDALAREAQALDGQPAQEAAAELQTLSAALATSNAAELLAALMMARGLALPILPKEKSEPLREVWTNDVLEQIAESGGLCLALSGQGVGDLLGKYAPYIALIGALVRPVLDTREIMNRPPPKQLTPVHTAPTYG